MIIPKINIRNFPLITGYSPFIVMVFIAMLALPTLAQEMPGKGPVLLQADEISRDDNLGIIIARGGVELMEGERVLFADVLSYNEKQDLVSASGNVTLVEASGEVAFADYMELSGDLRNGAIKQIRILLADKTTRLAASAGFRKDGMVTQLSKVVYSPCELCEKDPTRPPLWQIKADKVIHDQQKKQLQYRHARLEIGGVPVLYTPYFAHPDPTVKRKTGFLSPSFGKANGTSRFIRTPYFFNLGPDKDFTLDPIFNFSRSDTAFVLSGEYRQVFQNGALSVSGSLTRADRSVGLGDGATETRNNRLRGHVAAKGDFNLTENWLAGFDFNRATDETYLRRFNFWATPENSDDDYLTSNIYAGTFRGRDKIWFDAFSFQDLRTNTTDQQKTPPDFVALADYTMLGEGDLYGGRWSLDLNGRGINQDNASDNQRLAVDAGYQIPFTMSLGLVTTLRANIHGDMYLIDDAPRKNSKQDNNDHDVVARLLPSASVDMRLPFSRFGRFGQQIIEPVLKLKIAPTTAYDSKIPNSESAFVEHDVVNLFNYDRLPGLDRLDSGSRLAYGVRLSQFGAGPIDAEVFLGQNYTFNQSDDLNADTGLQHGKSDFVGLIDLEFSPYFSFSQNFALDEDDFAFNRNEVSASIGPNNHKLFSQYTYVSKDNDTLNHINQITVGLNTRIGKFWQGNVSTTRDLDDDKGGSSTLTSAVGLTYEDECLIVATSYSGDFTKIIDVPESNDFLIKVTFKTTSN